jgi:hypothetical protein
LAATQNSSPAALSGSLTTFGMAPQEKLVAGPRVLSAQLQGGRVQGCRAGLWSGWARLGRVGAAAGAAGG